MTRKATIVGGGLIWDGWVARLMLNGWDVSVFALDQRSEHKTDAVFENTRRALPPEGAIMFCDDIGETLINRSWVQESVPKRLDLKHKVHSVITKQTTREAIVGSSTLGFKQPDLIAGRTRIIVSPH